MSLPASTIVPSASRVKTRLASSSSLETKRRLGDGNQASRAARTRAARTSRRRLAQSCGRRSATRSATTAGCADWRRGSSRRSASSAAASTVHRGFCRRLDVALQIADRDRRQARQRLAGPLAAAVQQHDVADVARRRIAVGRDETVDAAVVAEDAIGQRQSAADAACRNRCAGPPPTPASSAAVPCCRGIRDRRRRSCRSRPSSRIMRTNCASSRGERVQVAGGPQIDARKADRRTGRPVVAARERRFVGRRQPEAARRHVDLVEDRAA